MQFLDNLGDKALERVGLERIALVLDNFGKFLLYLSLDETMEPFDKGERTRPPLKFYNYGYN